MGMVHVAALPGTPRGTLGVRDIAHRAAEEAITLAKSGFDAIIVENMHDAPYVHAGVDGLGHGPEIVSAMAACAMAVRAAVGDNMPVGIQVLAGGSREAIAIAHACGLNFVRCVNFVFAHVADEGLLSRAEAGPLLRYRKHIGAERVRIFCDLKKKHASHAITSDLSLADAAEGAEFFGARMGWSSPASPQGGRQAADDIAEVRGASTLPLMVGSGVTPDSARSLFDAGADALIVGSWIKRGGNWKNPVDPRRCRELVRAVRIG